MSKKNSYREFTDKLQLILGDLNWGEIGRLQKRYRQKHILKCAEGIPQRIKDQGPGKITNYLSAVCRNTATEDDLVKKENKVIHRNMVDQFSVTKRNRKRKYYEQT